MNLNEANRLWRRDMTRRSANTRRLYRTAIGHLMEYLQSEGRSPETMDTKDLLSSHVLGCVRALNESDLATTTVHNYLTGLMSFLRFLIINDLSGFDEIGLSRMRDRIISIVGRQPRRPLPRAVSDAEVAKLVCAAESARAQTPRLAMLRQRNLALLHALRSTGARVSEIINLTNGAILADDQAAIVTGKGEKMRMIFFDDIAWGSVQSYLTLRELYTGHIDPQTKLFLRHDRGAGPSEGVSATSVRTMLAALCHQAGLERTVTPHMFRHRLAIKVLARTNLAVTQDVLGHSNPATTRIYTQMAPEVLRQAVVSAGA